MYLQQILKHIKNTKFSDWSRNESTTGNDDTYWLWCAKDDHHSLDIHPKLNDNSMQALRAGNFYVFLKYNKKYAFP